MSRPRRIDGFDYLGPRQYFLTFCTRQRAPVFLDAAIAAMVLSQLRRTAGFHSFSLLAYCLMPDHVHALAEGLTSEADLRAFAKSAKESSGRAVARYIVENPLRAGLVDDPLEYPFVGSDRWTLRELLEGIY